MQSLEPPGQSFNSRFGFASSKRTIAFNDSGRMFSTWLLTRGQLQAPTPCGKETRPSKFLLRKRWNEVTLNIAALSGRILAYARPFLAQRFLRASARPPSPLFNLLCVEVLGLAAPLARADRVRLERPLFRTPVGTVSPRRNRCRSFRARRSFRRSFHHRLVPEGCGKIKKRRP
jgi:hypothetical protein